MSVALSEAAREFQNMPLGEAFKKEEMKYTPGTVWHNWVGTEGGCAPDFHHRPSTVEEVAAIVKQANKEGAKVKCAGSGHSPNNMAFTGSRHGTENIHSSKNEPGMPTATTVSKGGHLIHLKPNMRRITSVDSDKLTVTCEGGCTVEKLNIVLDHQELMLPMLLSVGDLTIAGVLSVAGHSTGINKPVLSSAVIAMTIVTGAGDVLRADSRTGENAEMLPALRCGLGVLGVICSVTLGVERKSIFKITSAPVSLSTVNRNLARKVTMSESYRFWYVPHTDMCYETIVNRVAPSEEGRQSMVGSVVASTVASSIAPNADMPSKANLQQRTRRNLNRAIQLVRPLHSEERSYMEWLAQEQSMPRRIVKSLQCPRAGLFVVEAALYAGCRFPKLQPLINKAYQRCYLSSEQSGYGTMADAFTIPIVLPQRATEWAVAAPRCLEVIDGLREIIRRNGLSVHFIVECRFVDEDDIWMSPCYKRKTCYVGLVQFRPFNKIDAPDTAKYYAEFSRYVIKKGGRPHWSKYHGTHWDFNAVYRSYPKWREFLALQKQLDPQGLFVNDWFRTFLPSSSKL